MTSPATQKPQNSSTHSPLENFIDGVANFLHLPVSGTAHDQSTGQNAEKAVALGHFSGKLANGGQSMTLFLKLKSGKLIGTYQAPSGKKYDVQGTLTGQQTISLQTTAQDVHIEIAGMLTKDQFVGTLSNPKHGYVSSFSLKPSGAAAPTVTPKPAQQAETPAEAPASGAGNAGAEIHDHLARKNINSETISAVNSLNYIPKSHKQKDRFQVYFNIVDACRRLGAAFPELIAAQWAIESHWGDSESGSNNLFGIKEFNANKPRSWHWTKEKDPKTGKLVPVRQPFADYQDYTDGLLARINFTIDNPRYRKSGYFEAQTLHEAAVAIARAGYGTDGKYLEVLLNTMKGCGVDVEAPIKGSDRARATSTNATTATSAAGTATPPISGGVSVGQQGGRADALDKLMGFPAAKVHYSVAEIATARTLIAKQLDEKTRGDLYELLQAKVPYHNQRNNQSIGRREDNSEWRDKYKRMHRTIWENKAIGDIMCNLTSLAMVLETLGIENPKDEMQYEDYLEAVRRDKDLPYRTYREGWSGVAEQLNAKRVMYLDGFKGGKDEWSDKILPHIRSGHGVMMSLNGHIMRLQDINEKGIVVDDPYGELPKLTDFNPRAVTASYGGQLNSRTSENGRGEDNLYPWDQVSKFHFLWIAAFDRK